MIGCAAWAGPMRLQMPEAELPAIIAVENTLSQSMLAEGDTMVFLPGTAICRRMPAGDQQGLYYMVLSLLKSQQEIFPQAQVHMLVEDTLTITDESTKFISVVYQHTETVGANAIDLSGDLLFLEYYVDGSNTYAKYDIDFTMSFDKNRPVEVKYRGFVTFYDGQGKTYVPTHEPFPSGISSTTSIAPAVKTLRNGQLVIEHNGHRYSALGQRVEL